MATDNNEQKVAQNSVERAPVQTNYLDQGKHLSVHLIYPYLPPGLRHLSSYLLYLPERMFAIPREIHILPTNTTNIVTGPNGRW